MFLKDNWERLLSMHNVTHLGPVAESEGPYRSWCHDRLTMDRIVEAIHVIRPKVLIELGTFQGFGTLRIAQTMRDFPVPDQILWTIDCIIPVEWNSGLKSFIQIPRDNWVKEVLDHYIINMLKIKDLGVNFKPIIGDTIKSLPTLLENEVGQWDFCFQDSVHIVEPMLIEWGILQGYSKVGSLAVFDDVQKGHPFIHEFPSITEGFWDYRQSDDGAGQLWLERLE